MQPVYSVNHKLSLPVAIVLANVMIIVNHSDIQVILHIKSIHIFVLVVFKSIHFFGPAFKSIQLVSGNEKSYIFRFNLVTISIIIHYSITIKP